jgi:hypothetical protein
MKTTLITFAIAAALGALAGCDRDTEQRTPTTATPTPSAGAGASSTREATTPSTPANTGNAKSEGKQPPVQGREDVRQPEQQRDFQQKGDGAGPKPGG